ncbi:MAG: hypothetical protein CMF48_03485 [Legionellales bacterium]|nr:hypothetical protein [Legionellales bacterium]|tara:strand:+ start:1122 stop:1340 length:219 start_codon:yes stop_codon:yes gene_type:complete
MKKLTEAQAKAVAGGFHLLFVEDYQESGQTMVRILAGEGEISDGLVVAGGSHLDSTAMFDCPVVVDEPDFPV